MEMYRKNNCKEKLQDVLLTGVPPAVW